MITDPRTEQQDAREVAQDERGAAQLTYSQSQDDRQTAQNARGRWQDAWGVIRPLQLFIQVFLAIAVISAVMWLVGLPLERMAQHNTELIQRLQVTADQILQRQKAQ